MSATIGIHVLDEPSRLRATLERLVRLTPDRHEIVLLVDAPDRAMLAALEELAFPKLWLETASGGSAAFNLLCAHAENDIAVLLESGCLVGPGWLDQLLAALDGREDNGLAGPSTNLSWNEQGVFPYAEAGPDQIDATAAEALRCYEGEARTLEPLYSLGDFCYAVKREVWETIGPADEAYGPGPCWEMDYNIRAARAGYRGVWVGAAYVYRRPGSPRQARESRRLFEANKQLYQGKFCDRLLRDPGAFFRDHCQGDACRNFARFSGAAPPRRGLTSAMPLVTCLMPTFNRREFLPGSIDSFLAQDYPHRELLILDDGTDSVEDLVPRHPRIRYERLDGRLNIGRKRNLGCEMARGELIAHWDDDDWYPAWRLSRQVREIRDAHADVCGTSVVYYYDPDKKAAYKYVWDAEKDWLGGNTLLYTKEYWQRQPFADVEHGEDALFLWDQPRKRVADLRDPELCVARLHESNTSAKPIEGTYWHKIPSSEIEAVLKQSRWPLVSCLLVTRDRRPFLARSFELFLAQDYPRLELVVVDDGDDPIRDAFPAEARIEYVRLQHHTTIGEKRNIACRAASGEILIQWDDDDWYSPGRVRVQVEPILRGDADITGLVNTYTLDLSTGTFLTISDDLHRRMFVRDVHGGTLAFRRSILGGSVGYPHVNLAEDAALLDTAARQGFRLARLDNPGLFVYVRHGRNAWQFEAGEYMDREGWKTIRRPDGFSALDLESLQAAAEECALDRG